MSLFFQKLRSLLRRRQKEEDLRDELQFHLDEETEERQAEGSSGEEARHAIGRGYRRTVKRLGRTTEDLRERIEDLLDQAGDLRAARVLGFRKRLAAERRSRAA